MTYNSIYDLDKSIVAIEQLILGEGNTSHMMFRISDDLTELASGANESTWEFMGVTKFRHPFSFYHHPSKLCICPWSLKNYKIATGLKT